MTGLEIAFAVGQRALEDGDGVGLPPGGVIGVGQVAARDQGVLMIRPADPLAVRDGALVQRRTASAILPAEW